MSRAYSDFATGLDVTQSGNVKIVYDEEVIFQSLRHIFATVSGERVRNPIGSALIRYLFEPVTQETSREIRTEIKENIERWEPRVNLLRIFVRPDENNNRYQIRLEIDIPLLRKKTVFSTRLRSFVE